MYDAGVTEVSYTLTFLSRARRACRRECSRCFPCGRRPGVGYRDAVFLSGGVGAPLEVLVEKIARSDCAIQSRAAGGRWLSSSPAAFFQNCLDLCAVFADDVRCNSGGFVNVICEEIDLVVEQMSVERAEGAEGVGRKSILSVRSEVIMTSGQCTIGAMTKVNSCLPVLSLSPSATMWYLSVSDRVKNCPSMVFIFALQTMVTSGVTQGKLLYRCRVIRLHVGNDKIIEAAFRPKCGRGFQKRAADGLVNGVEQNGLSSLSRYAL